MFYEVFKNVKLERSVLRPIGLIQSWGVECKHLLDLLGCQMEVENV